MFTSQDREYLRFESSVSQRTMNRDTTRDLASTRVAADVLAHRATQIAEFGHVGLSPSLAALVWT